MISICNLSVQIGDRVILQNVDFKLPTNGFMAVIGPNGGGKSTLIRCILNLQSYDGTVEIDPGHAAQIGYVPQIKTLDRTFPARANELVATALKKKWPWSMDSACKQVVESALEMVGAAHLRNQQIRNLSGGELQRVYLARAVIGNPKLLILDEPSAGVDQVGASDLLEIVELYRKRTGATVIMITHDWEVAFHHATHVLVLKTHQVAFGEASEALTESAIREAFGHVGHSHAVLSGGTHA
ncbi:MAG: metal ABC transporter ATP-binding protein [Bacteroidetes bacterium]|nr:metal ABC transporter ATP-binding protein [Bacteroidota bacterium]